MQRTQRARFAEGPHVRAITIGIIESYKRFGAVHAGPRKYQQEVSARVAHSNKALMQLKKSIIANEGFPQSQRATVWKAIVLSEVIYHCATWGVVVKAKCTATVTSAYHKGLRVIRGRPTDVKLAVHTRTDIEVRAHFDMPDLGP